MEQLTKFTAIAAPILRSNIDTDVIIPSREIKGVSKTGLGQGMFANWRYADPPRRTEDPNFILNREPYRRARILLAGENFGCGSSREHAVWAIAEYGIRVIIAPSFGSIFYGNCVCNGILPLVLPLALIRSLAERVENDPAANLVEVDLERQTVGIVGEEPHSFAIPAADKEQLVEGLDALDLALKRIPAIDRFEAQDRKTRPWVYLEAR